MGGEGDLRDRVSSWIAGQSMVAVVAAFGDARVPIVPVNDLAAVVSDPQIVARASVGVGETGWVPAPVPRIGMRGGGADPQLTDVSR